MQKVFNKILVGVFAVVLLLPAVSLAGLKLQQNYPPISGITSGEVISLNDISQAPKNAPSNTVSLIKYLFNLSIIILIGLATLALIIAGVQYVSSAGKPVAQKAARTRILRAFIGLAILFSANLIFSYIIPDFKIPELEHIYGVSNVVLINQQGLNEIREQAIKSNAAGGSSLIGITKEFLNGLADAGKLRYFSSQSPNLEDNFGQLTKRPSFEVSFEDFDPAYIGFFGTGKSNIQVKAFSGKNFLGKGYIYSTEGIMNNNDAASKLVKPTNDNIINSVGGLSLTVYPLEKNKYATNQAYLDSETQKEVVPAGEIGHPPLSMLVEGIGAGVYLYGSLTKTPASPADQPNISGDVPTGESIKYIGGKGGQRYLQFDIPNFAEMGFDFDEQADKIEIKNNRQLLDKNAKDDLLVFLFQQPYYQGPFRSFFEKRDVSVADVFNSSKAAPESLWYDDDKKDKTKLIAGVYLGVEGFVEYKFTKKYPLGNTIENVKNPALNKISANGADHQGKVFGVSSARVFHLADLDQVNATYKATCEVVLCNAEDLRGYCLAFTPDGKSNGAFQSFFLPMPWLMPVSIPKELSEDMHIAMLVGEDEKLLFMLKEDQRKFNDNIKSIGIKGKCVVALYENSVKTPASCFTQNNQKSCWENNTPGEKSMVFSWQDMVSGTGRGQTPYLNLKNYPINDCLSHWGPLNLSKRHSCASAVAIFPVK